MKVKDILRTPYTYFNVDDTLHYIVKIFNERHIASAPVVKEGAYIGVISDSSIAKRFLPKKFLGIWTFEEPAPITVLRNVTAEGLVDKTAPAVLGEDDLIDVLPLIVNKRYDCIPVVESKESMKLTGMIRGADIVRLFLRYFAVYEAKELEKASTPERLQMETMVGRILSTVEKEGRISSDAVAKRLSITPETAERIGIELEKHGLIMVRYKLFQSPVFEKIERFG